MARLTVEVSPNVKKVIRVDAIRAGKTMGEYLEDWLMQDATFEEAVEALSADDTDDGEGE